jgi:hypothetical protein
VVLNSGVVFPNCHQPHTASLFIRNGEGGVGGRGRVDGPSIYVFVHMYQLYIYISSILYISVQYGRVFLLHDKNIF